MATECIDCAAVLQYGEEFTERICLACERDGRLRERASWQEAALKLRKELFAEHQRACGLPASIAPVHTTVECPTCKLLTETRWCMLPVTDVL